IQNEPDFQATYESCLWNSSQFLAFFQTNLGAFSGLNIVMPESESFTQSISNPTLNDANAVTNVSIVAGHLYGNPPIVDYSNAHNKGKPTWMTEFLVNDQTIGTAITTAKQIHDCLTVANMSAYIWWKCLGDANGLVNASGVPQRRGFVMAQFSRFVRPGWTRIGATYTGAVLVTAFRESNSNAFAVVAINPTGIALTPSFHFQNFPPVAGVTPWITSPDVSLAAQSGIVVTNGAFTFALPGLSVVTFASQPNHTPVLAPISDQTINPGFALNLTNLASD